MPCASRKFNCILSIPTEMQWTAKITSRAARAPVETFQAHRDYVPRISKTAHWSLKYLANFSLLCYFAALLFPVLTNLIGLTMSVATSKLVTRPLPSRLKCIRNWPSLRSPVKPSGKAGSTS